MLGVLLGSPLFTYGQVNLALNKVAKQNTTNTSGNYSAANAVDGSTTTISATSTTPGNNWWQIDLGNYYQIDKIVVKHRGDLKFFYVIASDIPFNAFPVSQSMTHSQMQGHYKFAAHSPNSSNPKTMEFPVNHKICRYVRVEHDSKNTTARDLVLDEVEVIGNPTAVNHTPPYSNVGQILVERDALETEKGSTHSQGEFIKDPNIRIPQNMQNVRGHMLEIANLCRRDPDYRKNHAYDSNHAGTVWATNLSGSTTLTNLGQEQLYKTNQSAPYFTDLVENESLRKAAQFYAEYMAKHRYLGHDLNHDTDYYLNGQTHTVKAPNGERIKIFGFTGQISGEACSMDLDPQTWTRGNTHFRPFFNVGSKVSAVGFGAAKGADGKWYVCAIFDKVN